MSDEAFSWSDGDWRHTLAPEGHIWRWISVWREGQEGEARNDYGLIAGGQFVAIRRSVHRLSQNTVEGIVRSACAGGVGWVCLHCGQPDNSPSAERCSSCAGEREDYGEDFRDGLA